MTTTAAPYFLHRFAFSINSSCPSFKLMELTTHFPCKIFNPPSMTLHFDESIITGTLQILGSVANSLKKCCISISESNIPSSILISII